MKIKITEAGWETYTGDLGTARFEDGVSVTDMPYREAQALGAHIAVVEIDDAGKELGSVSPGLDMVRHAEAPAEIEVPLLTLKEVKAAEALKDQAVKVIAATQYTQESLEAIASEKGIAGIREISDPMKIKGTSIRTLIAEILLRGPQPEITKPEKLAA